MSRISDLSPSPSPPSSPHPRRSTTSPSPTPSSVGSGRTHIHVAASEGGRRAPIYRAERSIAESRNLCRRSTTSDPGAGKTRRRSLSPPREEAAKIFSGLRLKPSLAPILISLSLAETSRPPPIRLEIFPPLSRPRSFSLVRKNLRPSGHAKMRDGIIRCANC